MALFAVAAFLLFLIQCLRLFDLVSTRGQSLLTLLGQAVLGMPSLGIVVLYVCLGIGLGRALRSLQDRSELHIIHASALTGPLMRSVVSYGIAGAVLVLGLSHFIDPLSARTTRDWSESIAADLVSRSMVPHRFTEVVDGVSMIIGSRNAQGEITDFFADDTRNENSRRTYFARRALITRDEEGFVLRMRDGAIQQVSDDHRMTEITFEGYDLALDQLTGDTEEGTDSLAQTTSFEILGEWVTSGDLSRSESRALVRRTMEGVRVLAMSLFVAALGLFPSGNRRSFGLPIELVVLGAAFLERGVTSYAPLPQPFDLVSGPGLLLLVAVVILARRFRVFTRLPLAKAAR
jgi:lipopolysaccharide export system permease protein